MTIAYQIQRFLDQHAARSEHTAKTYRTGLAHFVTYLQEHDIDLEDEAAVLTRAVALDFIPWLAKQRYERAGQERQLAMRTRQNYIMAVAGLYKQMALEGTLEMGYGDYMALINEMVKRTKFKDVPIEKKLPPEEAVDAVITAIKEPPAMPDDIDERTRRRLHLIWLRDKAILLCLYSSGMRVGELVSLRREDLDYPDQGAWVRGKGDRERFVRFSRETWLALQAYLEARHDEWLDGAINDRPVFCRHDRASGDFRRLPLGTLAVERMITKTAKDAGVFKRFHLTPHSFRHYFATRFLQHTGNLALTQDVLGHASPQTTRIYAKTTKEQHIAAHEELFDEADELDET